MSRMQQDAIKKLQTELQQMKEKLVEATTLVVALTNQIQEGSKAYMHTLGAIAKANGGEIRIPCAAIDSVEEHDVIENRLDELNDCIVFTIRKPGTDAPSGIILPGRTH